MERNDGGKRVLKLTTAEAKALLIELLARKEADRNRERRAKIATPEIAEGEKRAA